MPENPASVNLLKNGDTCLSAFDRHIWNLTYSCLTEFGCPVIHKITGPDSRQQLDRLIRFFVPDNHPRAQEVMEYLRNELRGEISTPQGVQPDGHYAWGTFVEVMRFRGLDPYVQAEVMEAMIENVTADLLSRLKSRPVS